MQIGTRQREERKGKSIKVPSRKCPQVLWLQEHKEAVSLVGGSTVATCKRRQLEHAQQPQQEVWAAAETTEHQGLAAAGFPHNFPATLRATDRGMGMGGTKQVE